MKYRVFNVSANSEGSADAFSYVDDFKTKEEAIEAIKKLKIKFYYATYAIVEVW